MGWWTPWAAPGQVSEQRQGLFPTTSAKKQGMYCQQLFAFWSFLFCTYKVQPCAFELHPMFGIVLRRAFAGQTQFADAPKEAGHWEMVVGAEYWDVDPKNEIDYILVSTISSCFQTFQYTSSSSSSSLSALKSDIINHIARSKSNKFV